jgi:hypothetical protein
MVHILIFDEHGNYREFDRDFPLGVQYAADRCRETSHINGLSYFVYDNESCDFAIVEDGIFLLQNLSLC